MKMSNDEFFMAVFVINKKWSISETAKRFGVPPATVQKNMDKYAAMQNSSK